MAFALVVYNGHKLNALVYNIESSHSVVSSLTSDSRGAAASSCILIGGPLWALRAKVEPNVSFLSGSGATKANPNNC